MSSDPNLRGEMRKRREELDEVSQLDAAQSICQKISTQPWFARARRIAFYWAYRGEVDNRPLMDAGVSRGLSCFLPVIDAGSTPTLRFRSFAPDAIKTLQPNRFGIPEPVTGDAAAIEELDIIIMPLVAFDRSGNRLGMGQGYYDRALAGSSDRPLRVGLAHGFQEVATLQPSTWDIPLHIIATPTELIRTRHCPVEIGGSSTDMLE